MRLASALALLGLLAAPLTAADGPVTLTWSLKEGDVFYAKSVQDMDMTMGILGMTQDIKQKSTTVVRFKVKSAKPTVVEMTYLDFKVEGGPPGAGGFGDKLKGVAVTATLDDKLKVTKVEGYDKFLDALGGGDPNMKMLMKNVMSEDTVKQIYSQTFAVAPGKAVKVGDTWTDADKLSMGPLGNFDLKQTFTLDSVSGADAKIGSKVEMTFKPAAGDGGGLPFKVTKADMKVDKYTAAHTFDTAAGRLKDSKADGTINGSMTAAAGGQEIEITMKMKMKQTTTVTEKNPVVD